MRSRNLGLIGASLAAIATMAAAPAAAQTATSEPRPEMPSDPQQTVTDDAADAATDEIVVTGTLIQGIAPVGTNVVGLSESDITATGVASSSDLLARVPQLASFGQLPAPGTANSSLPFSPPSLRGLGSLSSMATLILIDGQRVVPQGIEQTWIDTSMIPAGHLQRVEIIPDGGSSIYGSDAIGGVINFITKRRVEGVEAAARYGFADKFWQVDANVSAGHDWGSGSAALSLAYAKRDAVFGRDRDWLDSNHADIGGTDFRVTNCNPGNVVVGNPVIGTTVYPLPGTTPGAPNLCSNQAATSFYPAETRYSVFGSLTQDLSDAITFDLSGFWSLRRTVNFGCCNENITGVAGTGTITSANPYFRSRAGETSQSVQFNYSSVFGSARRSPSKFEAVGVRPSLSFDMGSSWKLRVGGNYGRSYNDIRAFGINTQAEAAALAGTTLATALNPYDPATSNPAVLAAIGNYLDRANAVQKLAEARAVLNGSLFALPGGDVRVALGTEYRYEGLRYFKAVGVSGAAPTTAVDTNRKVKSIYGEVFVPIVGPDNAVPGAQALELSLSGRYDDYDDVGSTTNPKVGATYQPFEQLTIRANWGTSFHAPGLGDYSFPIFYQVLPVSPFPPGSAAPGSPEFFRRTIILQGADPNMKPETATTWSIGGDFKPVSGVTTSLTYWNIDYKDRIDLNGQFFLDSNFYNDPLNTGYFIRNPSLAQVVALGGANTALTGAPSLASLYTGASGPSAVFDARRTNLGRLKTEGLDFSFNYNGDFGPASVNASVAGTYIINRKTQRIAGAGFIDNLRNGTGRWSVAGTLGGRAGAFNLQATVNYRDGYPIIGDRLQSDVGSFTSTNIFASYDIGGEGVLGGVTLTLNVDNLFDVDPPFRNSNTGVAFTNLGRLVTLGVRTKF